MGQENTSFYALIYLYEKGQFADCLHYIEENKEKLLEEVGSRKYLEALTYLFKIRNGAKINFDNIYSFGKSIDFSQFDSIDDRFVVFCVLFYLVAFESIDYTKENIFTDIRVKELVDYLRYNSNNVLHPYIESWYNTIVNNWSNLTERDKKRFLDSHAKVENTLFKECITTQRFKLHFSK